VKDSDKLKKDNTLELQDRSCYLFLNIFFNPRIDISEQLSVLHMTLPKMFTL